MGNRITYETDYPGNNVRVTVEIGRRGGVSREAECADIALSRALSIDVPLTLCCLVLSDGSVVEWYAEFKGDANANTYWHFDHGSDGKYQKPATRAQQETIARIWSGDVQPFGVRGSVGGPVMSWLGLTHEQVFEIVGRRVALA